MSIPPNPPVCVGCGKPGHLVCETYELTNTNRRMPLWLVIVLSLMVGAAVGFVLVFLIPAPPW